MTILEFLTPYGLFLVAPLGLRLCGPPPRWIIASCLAAAASTAALTMEQGWVAAVLAGPYLLFAAYLCAKSWTASPPAIRAALLQLLLSALWITASRAGVRLPHFPDSVVIMTALHFLYAGFAASVFVHATGRALGARSSSTLYRIASSAVLLGPVLMSMGTATHRWLEVIAGFALALAVTIIAALAMASSRNKLSQLCFSIAAASAVLGMTIAAMYLWTGIGGAFWLPIPQMAVAHGIANAIGFSTAGLLGHSLDNRP